MPLFSNPLLEPPATRAYLGQNSVVITVNTSPITGDFHAIQCVNDTVFSLLTETGVSCGALTGLTNPAGVTLYGRFSAYTLTSGAVRAHSV